MAGYYAVLAVLLFKTDLDLNCLKNYQQTTKPSQMGKELNTQITVTHVLSGHSKIDKAKVLKTNGSLMKVESIAECSLGAFCNTF